MPQTVPAVNYLGYAKTKFRIYTDETILLLLGAL